MSDERAVEFLREHEGGGLIRVSGSSKEAHAARCCLDIYAPGRKRVPGPQVSVVKWSKDIQVYRIPAALWDSMEHKICRAIKLKE